MQSKMKLSRQRSKQGQMLSTVGKKDDVSDYDVRSDHLRDNPSIDETEVKLGPSNVSHFDDGFNHNSTFLQATQKIKVSSCPRKGEESPSGATKVLKS